MRRAGPHLLRAVLVFALIVPGAPLAMAGPPSAAPPARTGTDLAEQSMATGRNEHCHPRAAKQKPAAAELEPAAERMSTSSPADCPPGSDCCSDDCFHRCHLTSPALALTLTSPPAPPASPLPKAGQLLATGQGPSRLLRPPRS